LGKGDIKIMQSVKKKTITSFRDLEVYQNSVLPGFEWVTSPYVKGRWGGVILFHVTRIPLSVWA